MSMHLDPRLTTTGKSKKRETYSSSQLKKKAEKNRKEWAKILKKYGEDPEAKQRTKGLAAKPYTPEPTQTRRNSLKDIPRANASWDNCTKPEAPVYTGDQMVGVTVLHKSCLQPVFNKEAAKDAAKMRR